MCNKFVGSWKLISSENFDDYMKELDSCNLRKRCTGSSAEMEWQGIDNKEETSRWENGGGMHHERHHVYKSL
ncbi:myelin P2 protein isoform X2 [Python bivittatus]|uniref:Myelin P2 protein isoform X2 n=1 Tax=Python bivittatus TaxID=176946 RepID=A0A9F5IIL5_PYTBI|nr:myelin P2 protein isoform X2 [Python bivittatus]